MSCLQLIALPEACFQALVAAEAAQPPPDLSFQQLKSSASRSRLLSKATIKSGGSKAVVVISASVAIPMYLL